jgi:hydroxyacylglutathione hydrolase
VTVAVPLDSVAWIHEAADCAASTDRLIHVHPFDADTFIMLFGNARAILFDTGGPPDPRERGRDPAHPRHG